MTRALKALGVVLLACLCQTNLSHFARVAGVAPDFMIAALAALGFQLGTYGGFCAGALMSLLYDASVGYVLAINLVGYTFIGYFCPFLRQRLTQRLSGMKHKRVLILILIAFAMTLAREILDAGYLFLIGAEQGIMTLVRALLCSGLTALAAIVWLFVLDRLFAKRKPRENMAMSAALGKKRKHEKKERNSKPAGAAQGKA